MSEPLASALCKIPANPDIAGIGVRISIYPQNIICILSALWALWDGKVTSGELEYAETQTLATTNLILAFAILIPSTVQASTLGISNYHANIALMMSWMNNTDAFVYFILYIHQDGVTRGRRWGSRHLESLGRFPTGDVNGNGRSVTIQRTLVEPKMARHGKARRSGARMDFAGVDVAFASSVEGLDGF
ncbi:hypothetical protein BKA70DRAFT_1567824 [Coprinopsis sp. MPI-PUGE-AT-0042]|nr:hypothetical protein BKA70DRAFT_1567824 [Coprinopsis sp. MPI-PUGE-AT-0042]